MSDYNNGLLPERCLRLDFGGEEYKSIELGDGTGFIRLSDFEEFKCKMDSLISSLSNGMISKSGADNSVIESVIDEQYEKLYAEDFAIERERAQNDLEIMKLYAGKVRDLLIANHQFTYSVFVRIPLENITVEDAQRMTDLYKAAYELGIEV